MDIKTQILMFDLLIIIHIIIFHISIDKSGNGNLRTQGTIPLKEILIRFVTAEDAHSVASLSDQLGYLTTPNQVLKRLNTLCETPGNRVFVAQAANGEVIGWVHVFAAQRLMVAPCAEIGALVVDQAWRSQGVGKRLLGAAESWARENGYARMRVRSNTQRVAAHNFYKGFGYQWEKNQQVFSKDLKSAE